MEQYDPEFNNFISNLISDENFLLLLYESCFNQPIIEQYGGNNNNYDIISQTTKRCRKFNCSEKIIKLRAVDRPMNNFTDAVEACQNLIRDIHANFIDPIDGNTTKVRCVIEHSDFDCPITFPFMKKSDLSPKMIFDQFSRVVQSKKKADSINVTTVHNIQLSIIVANLIRGSGKKRVNEMEEIPVKKIKKDDVSNFKDFVKFKRSIIEIYNEDNFCLIRAIIIAIAYIEKDKNYKNMVQRPNNKTLRSKIIKVANDCNISSNGCGIKDIERLEQYFENYQIMVIDKQYTITEEPIYLNKNKKFSKFIYLLYNENHFNVIVSMTAYLNKKFFCDKCKISFYHIGNHVCSATCKTCNRFNCKPEFSIKCKTCNKFFQNLICKELHEEKFCFYKKKCDKCNNFISLNKTHVCDNEKWCKNCSEAVSIDHKCFMLTEAEVELKNKNKQLTTFNGYIFFDFESYVEEKTSKHVVNLAMAQMICKKCLDFKYEQRCDMCKKKHVFYNIEDYCEWAFNQPYTIQIAHNLKGYDGVFILNTILKKILPTERLPDVILCGTKILTIMFKKIKIIDSYCFLAMPLSDFSKTFGITELKKGFFPHKFNNLENQNYIGTYPAEEFYQPEFFKAGKKQEFHKWYNNIKNEVFDFKKEFYEYCWSDVRLLAEGCMIFRKCCMNSTKLNENDLGVDPFQKALTIASFCNYVYRRNFMLPKTIAIIPENGYNPKQKTSKKAILWLKYIASSQNITIQHKNSIQGEYRCGKYFLDGIDIQNKTIYEFHGCYFHGCPHCFLPSTFNTVYRLHQQSVYLKHIDRISYIKESLPDFKLIEIWEHEWDDMSINDNLIKEFIKSELNNNLEQINPRDALFGGRTNALQLYYNCQLNEEIHYIDYTSLYPYVQKYGIYPIGHPEIICENFDLNKKYFGIIKCKILPPRNYIYLFYLLE